MKKDFKLILFPFLGLILFAAVMFALTKKEKTAGSEPTSNIMVPNFEREGNYKKGPSSARVQIIEFFDPECEGCAAFHPIVKKVLAEFPNDIEFVARYMLYHGNSKAAAFALEGAGAQGKYWEMYNILLERQDEWSHRQESVISIFEKFANELKLDINEFKKSFDNPVYTERFMKDINDGQRLGVKGTPTFFINGKMLMNLSYDDLKNAILNELK